MQTEEKRSSIDESGNVHRISKRVRLTNGQIIGDDNCPFLKRWVLIHDKGWAVRLHYFYPNHIDAVAHDHPFWFLTLVIKGTYVDHSLHNEIFRMDQLRRGSIRFRSANHAHKTETDERGAWTLMINGPKIRKWGFLPKVAGKFQWIPWTKFTDEGQQRAACED